MRAILLPRFTDAVEGGKVFFFNANTNLLTNVYSDATGETQLPNPISIQDNRAVGTSIVYVFVDDRVSIKIKTFDLNGKLVDTINETPSGGGGGGGGGIEYINSSKPNILSVSPSGTGVILNPIPVQLYSPDGSVAIGTPGDNVFEVKVATAPPPEPNKMLTIVNNERTITYNGSRDVYLNETHLATHWDNILEKPNDILESIISITPTYNSSFVALDIVDLDHDESRIVLEPASQALNKAGVMTPANLARITENRNDIVSLQQAVNGLATGTATTRVVKNITPPVNSAALVSEWTAAVGHAPIAGDTSHVIDTLNNSTSWIFDGTEFIMLQTDIPNANGNNRGLAVSGTQSGQIEFLNGVGTLLGYAAISQIINSGVRTPLVNKQITVDSLLGLGDTVQLPISIGSDLVLNQLIWLTMVDSSAEANIVNRVLFLITDILSDTSRFGHIIALEPHRSYGYFSTTFCNNMTLFQPLKIGQQVAFERSDLEYKAGTGPIKFGTLISGTRSNPSPHPFSFVVEVRDFIQSTLFSEVISVVLTDEYGNPVAGGGSSGGNASQGGGTGLFFDNPQTTLRDLDIKIPQIGLRFDAPKNALSKVPVIGEAVVHVSRFQNFKSILQCIAVDSSTCKFAVISHRGDGYGILIDTSVSPPIEYTYRVMPDFRMWLCEDVRHKSTGGPGAYWNDSGTPDSDNIGVYYTPNEQNAGAMNAGWTRPLQADWNALFLSVGIVYNSSTWTYTQGNVQKTCFNPDAWTGLVVNAQEVNDQLGLNIVPRGYKRGSVQPSGVWEERTTATLYMTAYQAGSQNNIQDGVMFRNNSTVPRLESVNGTATPSIPSRCSMRLFKTFQR